MKIPRFLPLTILEIEWIDSCSSQGWGSVESHLRDSTYCHCRTVGYLVRQSKDSLSVAQSYGDLTKNVADIMSIPIVSIKKIKKLR